VTGKEHARVQSGEPPRATKRLRSLADWTAAAAAARLTIVDLVGSDRDPNLTTPENDVLVLRPVTPE
jgi:hypothetical protein